MMNLETPALIRALHHFLAVDLGFSADSLLMCAGLGPMLLVALLFRRSLMSIWPWLAVVAVVFGRELWDLDVDLERYGVWRWRGSLHDAALTLFWPTAIWLGLHLRPPVDH